MGQKNVVEKINTHFIFTFIVAPCNLKIHWVLYANKCTNCISYIGLKLFILTL